MLLRDYVQTLVMLIFNHTKKKKKHSHVELQISPFSEEKDGDDANLQSSNGGLAATLFGESSSSGSVGGVKNPEDTIKEQHRQNQQEEQQQLIMMDDYDKIEEPNNDNLDEDDEDDEEVEEQMKMAYKIHFQRQNVGSSNGGGNGATSFLAMVQ